MSMKWYVTQPHDKKEIPETRGKSKQEAQELFLLRIGMLKGLHQPWDWWEKQGYKIRRD